MRRGELSRNPTAQHVSGKSAGKFTYDFPSNEPNNYVVFLRTLPIAGQPDASARPGLRRRLDPLPQRVGPRRQRTGLAIHFWAHQPHRLARDDCAPGPEPRLAESGHRQR